jgi:hypothetical protein
MLFLGEINDADALRQILGYVEHTASIMHRFWLSVDRRGELGPAGVNGRQMADVLFFDNYNIEWLADIRSNLLKNSDILKAYNSVEQFPEWVPHLTLGYPDTPANDDAVDFPISGVSFDRLAVWVDEFDGPEFVLPRQDDMVMADRVREFLAHHGVKGMKWGVRKKGSRVTKGARTNFKKPPRKLSNDQLNKRIKRMETEKKYNSLNKKDLSAGQKFAQEVLSSAGRKVATTVVTGAALAGIKAALTAKFGSDVAEAVTRRLK